MARKARLLAAAGVLLAFIVALPGQAAADDVPVVSIGDAAAVEEGAVAEFTVSLSQAAPDPVTVTYETVDGTAVAPGDYAQESDTITFEPGETSKTIDIQTADEVPSLDEDSESFTVALSAATGASLGDSSGSATITDDDDPPSVASISDDTVEDEGDSGTVPASVTVTLSAASGKQVTVPYATAPGTATEADYEPKSGSFVFAPGDTSETIVVNVKGDTLFEPDETFSVVITDPINATAGADNRGEITIKDDDSSPIPTVTSPSVPEGDVGLTDLTFVVSLPGPRPQVSFNYRTVAGTATADDYTEIGGAQITFPASTSSTPTELSVTVKVKADTLDEYDESFTLQLLNPTTQAEVATGTGTIVNDDDKSQLSISDAAVDEPTTGTATMTFTVTLSQASARDVSVSWATADGTATAGTDYVAASGGTVSLAPGETSKTVSVSIQGDTINEENETLLVNLSAAVGAGIADGQGQGTIVDKNAPPSLSISDVVTREGAGAAFTVTLSGTTLRTVTVRFSTVDGLAKAGSDYSARVGTLSFAPGEKTKTIEVTVIDDAATETSEDFTVSIGDAVNATITKSSGRATIEASDLVATPTNNRPPVNAPPPPKPTPPKVVTPRMVLGPRTVSVGANGIARMLVTCQKTSPLVCAGTVQLDRAAKPFLTLGRKAFAVKKGKKAYASIKLNRKALTLLRKSGTLRAKVIVLVKTSAKKPLKVSPGVVTLRSTLPKAKTTAKSKSAAPPARVTIDP